MKIQILNFKEVMTKTFYLRYIVSFAILFAFQFGQDCGMGLGTSSTYADNQGVCNGTTLRECPAGMVVVGYKGRMGAIIDAFQLGCQTLESNGTLSGSVQWITDWGGNGVSSGMYFVKVESGTNTAIQKLMLLK